jgi:uncharacterized protein
VKPKTKGGRGTGMWQMRWARLTLWSALAAAPAFGHDVKFDWNVTIPMRDGVNLHATLYRPQTQAQGGSPCIFTLTPYIADSYHDRGMYFAEHGYPFLAVDVRGRGSSQGVFKPMLQEAKDGYDVVEWLALEPYCSGKVAMWGGSYAGYDQWATAKEMPPHLATIVPAAAPYIGLDFPIRNNISYAYVMQWLTYTDGHALQLRLFGDGEFWRGMNRRWYASGQPFKELDSLIGNPSAAFQEWVAHPKLDSYWDGYNPTRAQLAALTIPILTITGAYDDDQPGALEHYRQYMASASPQARARHYLVIGPWDHGGTRTPKAEVGGLKFGPDSVMDLGQLHLDWYAWSMAGGHKPEFLADAVAYYVTGAERWRFARSLESVTLRMQPLYLDSSGDASRISSGGQLRAGLRNGPQDSYQYDPRAAGGPEIDAEYHRNPESLTDQSLVLALQGRELVYDSQPFDHDTEISGFFKLAAWIAINCPDTDFYASVYEIAADGSSVRLTTDALRARYREGLRSEKLITTMQPLRYEFDHFTFVARELKRGSRLRLVIAPLGNAIGATFNERNFNGGGVVAAESSRDGRVVTVRLLHDRAHPSALSVPLGASGR